MTVRAINTYLQAASSLSLQQRAAVRQPDAEHTTQPHAPPHPLPYVLQLFTRTGTVVTTGRGVHLDKRV